MKMNKTIKEKTEFINASQLREVELTETHQIRCKFSSLDREDKMFWNGEIQKVYLDKDGEAVGYSVFVY